MRVQVVLGSIQLLNYGFGLEHMLLNVAEVLLNGADVAKRCCPVFSNRRSGLRLGFVLVEVREGTE